MLQLMPLPLPFLQPPRVASIVVYTAPFTPFAALAATPSSSSASGRSGLQPESVAKQTSIPKANDDEVYFMGVLPCRTCAAPCSTFPSTRLGSKRVGAK